MLKINGLFVFKDISQNSDEAGKVEYDQAVRLFKTSNLSSNILKMVLFSLTGN